MVAKRENQRPRMARFCREGIPQFKSQSTHQQRKPIGDQIDVNRIGDAAIVDLGENLEKDVRWIILGDDDAFFMPENLVRVLRKYDHNQYYYIGSISDTHLRNVRLTWRTAAKYICLMVMAIMEIHVGINCCFT